MAKATKQSKAAPAVLATLPEMVHSQQDGITLLDWFNGLVKFFQRAQALEQRAKATLDAARALQAPASAEQDEALQVFVRRASADIKETEDHWEITSLVSRFHKRLVGARKRSTDALDSAKALAQQLHNDYVAAERRRVEREQAIERQMAEARAAADRQRELDALEAKAIAAEQASGDLSDRERAFVEAVAKGGNAVTVARSVGYKQPDNQAARLLQTPKIFAAIEAIRNAALIRDQQRALEAQPLDVAVREVEAQIGKGGVDRATWSAEVVDLDAFKQGVKDGSIPLDCILPNGSVLNSYARSLHENLNRWPGVRAVKKVTTV